MGVADRFNKLVDNLTLKDPQRRDGITKHTGVRTCLNSHYYNSSSAYNNSLLVGSWGKSTEMRPPRDIDVLFQLPRSVYDKYQLKPGAVNKQSEILQEVKRVLQRTYSSTKMRADGQVVVVPFASYAVEVAPAFALDNGRYWICDTNAGGRYKEFDPVAEQAAVKTSNDASNGNTRDLIRLMKRWQGVCNVPLKSFWIELLVIDFLAGWQYAGKNAVYYDWMVRDFLSSLIGKTRGYVMVPGTCEFIWIGSDWESKARTAHARAIKGCEYEAAEKNVDAWWEWHNIFGDSVPLNP